MERVWVARDVEDVIKAAANLQRRRIQPSTRWVNQQHIAAIAAASAASHRPELRLRLRLRLCERPRATSDSTAV